MEDVSAAGGGLFFFFAVKCFRWYRSDNIDGILVPQSRFSASLFDLGVCSPAVSEFTPGRMSPHLGAMGAEESSAIPMACWQGRNGSDLKNK